ncbi:MAG TPA: tRNA dihydrouridine synthase DusB [Eggerthellaceae bacterium]|nr:tRNA dihydrouridine synthase DusB [Eggerthellaceae bacterium]
MKGLFGKYRVMLAPMAGVSDIAMRTLCREQGADIAFTEMVSAKGLSFANGKTRHLLDLAQGEDQVAVQIFGHEPQTMAAQAQWIEDQLGNALSHIDVNMGCPVRKIAGKGDGAALMRDPQLAERIMSSITRAIQHPATCKFRRGWDASAQTAPEFARRMEQAGAAAVTVHGRYASQMYRGHADWGAIAAVKDAVSVPVVGNGDVFSGADARHMAETTGCDAIMIARGAQGNPWIFNEVKNALEGREWRAPSTAERIAMAHRHAALLSEREGRNIVRMRKHAMWYVKGLPGATRARTLFNDCCTLEDFDRVFEELIDHAASSL